MSIFNRRVKQLRVVTSHTISGANEVISIRWVICETL